jgi:diguanylate cyclase (GGDEF)-like protein
VLSEALRDTDLLARFGGDEFAIATRILATGDLAKITGLAERIRQKLQIPMPAPTGTIEVCGTIGIGLYPADADDMDRLFICADQAMYAGKKAGRNRVVLFKDMPKAPEQ